MDDRARAPAELQWDGARPQRRTTPAAGRSPAADRPAGLVSPPHRPGGVARPRELIARVGEYVELPSAAVCCGAAGSYSIVRAHDSARVLDPHLDEIAAADLDVLVVVNAGCYRQLQQGIKRRKLRTRVIHIAELLAERLRARGWAGPAISSQVLQLTRRT